MSKKILFGEKSMCGQCCWQNGVQGISCLFASRSPEEHHCIEECDKMESEVSNKPEQRKGLNRTPQKQSRQHDYIRTKYQENAELTRVLAYSNTAGGKRWKQK